MERVLQTCSLERIRYVQSKFTEWGDLPSLGPKGVCRGLRELDRRSASRSYPSDSDTLMK